MPGRRNLTIEISHISPKAKVIADRQIDSITCAHAEWAVDFINSPSCRAGTYFRYAAKVSKDAPKGKGKPFRAVSLFPLETLFPSAESRTASARQACGVLRLRKRQGSLRDAGQRPVGNAHRYSREPVFSQMRNRTSAARNLTQSISKTGSREVNDSNCNHANVAGIIFTIS